MAVKVWRLMLMLAALTSYPKAQSIKTAQTEIFSFSAWEQNDMNSQASNVQNSLGKYSISYFRNICTLLEVLSLIFTQ